MIIVRCLPDRKACRRGYAYCWRYRTECARCGRMRDRLHYSIVERVMRNIRSCRFCVHEDAEDDNTVLSFDYDGWVTPPWPAASSISTAREW